MEIKKEELETLKTEVSLLQSLKIKLAELELSKLDIISTITLKQSEINVILENIKSEYGDVSIDLSNGKIIKK